MTKNDLAAAKGSLSPEDYAELSAAVNAGTVHAKNYLQSFNNGTDGETQSGTFYYDGSHAWVDTPYRGINGTHDCHRDWAVGYSVELQSCTDTGSSTQRNLSMRWKFTPFVSAFPISWTESHTLHVNSSGTIWQ